MKPCTSIILVVIGLHVCQAFLSSFFGGGPNEAKTHNFHHQHGSRPAQDRTFFLKEETSYHGPKQVHIRIPNELDATVDTNTPTLPHPIPVHSNIKPLDYLKQYHGQQDYGNLDFTHHETNFGPEPSYPYKRETEPFVPEAQTYSEDNRLDQFRFQQQQQQEQQYQLLLQQQEQQQKQLQQQQLIREQQQQQQQLLFEQQQRQLQQQHQNAQRLQHQQLDHQPFEATIHNSNLQKRKISSNPRELNQCENKYAQLLGDIFMGHELVPEVIDTPPENLLELTYRTVRTYPGMKVTADVTRFNPMLRWPTQEDAFYTIILSNLDINSRKNRTLAEYWHWLVVNVHEDDIDNGQVLFELLHPLVLPDGDGDHRFAYFVLKQPHRLDFTEEGGPSDSCSSNMSKGRGPYRSTRDFMKKYHMELTAATFLIVDHSEASDEIACEWQKCMRGKSFLHNLSCDQVARQRRKRKFSDFEETRPRHKSFNHLRQQTKKNSFWYL